MTGGPEGRAETAIVFKDYDPAWSTYFEQEMARLSSASRVCLNDLQHFGSTAIPKLIAKPIIDMMAPVANLDEAHRCGHTLRSLGYCPVETDFAQRALFRRDDPFHQLAYHLHLVVCDHWPAKNELLFRDWLRTHEDAAMAYAELKRSVAVESDGDERRYTYGKSDFIRSIVCKARHAAGLPPETDWSE